MRRALLLAALLATAAAFPVSLRAAAEARRNTCQCECCYVAGVSGRTRCVPPVDTSFPVASCPDCNVAECATRFPLACSQVSAVVNTDCVVRKGWLLRAVPILFIAASACLLVYGFCFKTYDGYHDERTSSSQGPRSLSSTISGGLLPNFVSARGVQRSYGSTRQDGQFDQDIPSLMPPGTRSIHTSLPPISETDELLQEPDSPSLPPPGFADTIPAAALSENIDKEDKTSTGSQDPYNPLQRTTAVASAEQQSANVSTAVQTSQRAPTDTDTASTGPSAVSSAHPSTSEIKSIPARNNTDATSYDYSSLSL